MSSLHGIVERIDKIEDRLTVVERATANRPSSSASSSSAPTSVSSASSPTQKNRPTVTSSSQPRQIKIALIRTTQVIQGLEESLTEVLNGHLNVKVNIQTLNMSAVPYKLDELANFDFGIVVGFTPTIRIESKDMLKAVQDLTDENVPVAILVLLVGEKRMDGVQIRITDNNIKKIPQFNLIFSLGGSLVRTNELTQEAISGLVGMIKAL
jgi:hypothetical protein